jgi:hypothetical protein
MLVVNWLLGRRVQYVGLMDSKIAVGQLMLVANWVLDRKVNYVGLMDCTVGLGQ